MMNELIFIQKNPIVQEFEELKRLLIERGS